MSLPNAEAAKSRQQRHQGKLAFKQLQPRCAVQMGKPVFVASQLLNSMIDVPVPTRAEVADCADAVRQQADALMLSGETAAGMSPSSRCRRCKGCASMRSVAGQSLLVAASFLLEPE